MINYYLNLEYIVQGSRTLDARQGTEVTSAYSPRENTAPVRDLPPREIFFLTGAGPREKFFSRGLAPAIDSFAGAEIFLPP